MRLKITDIFYGQHNKIGGRGSSAAFRLKAPKGGVFINFGLEQSPVLRGFSKTQISRLCAKLSSGFDLHYFSLELRHFSSPNRIALFRYAPSENSKSKSPKY